eukprot:m.119408 g.119408  ORF g.119408 m.119408 type:complete len:592 (+) comp12908_c0_seq1:80-1855(+)
MSERRGSGRGEEVSDRFNSRRSSDSGSEDEVALRQQLADLRQETERVVQENESLYRTLEDGMDNFQSADGDHMRHLLSEVAMLNRLNDELQQNLQSTKQESKQHLQETVELNAELAERTYRLQQIERDLQEIAQMNAQMNNNQQQNGHEKDAAKEKRNKMDGVGEHENNGEENYCTSEHPKKQPTVTFKSPTTHQQHTNTSSSIYNSHSETNIVLDVESEAAEELIELRNECNKIKQTNKLLERELKQRDMIIGEKDGIIEEMQREMHVLRSRTDAQQQHIGNLKLQHEEEKQSLAANIHEEVSNEVLHRESKMGDWEKSLLEREKFSAKLTTKIKQLQNENRALQLEIQVLQDTPQEKLVEVTQTNTRMMTALVTAQSARDEALLKAEHAEKKMLSLKSELKQTKTSHLTQVEALSEHIRRLETDNASLEEKTNELKVQFINASSTSETTEIKTSQQQRKAHARQSALEAHVRKANQQLAIQRDTVTSLKRSLKQANREIEIAQNVIDEDVVEMEQLTDTVEQLQVQNHDLFSKLRFFMQRETELTCELEDTRLQLHRGKFYNTPNNDACIPDSKAAKHDHVSSQGSSHW